MKIGGFEKQSLIDWDGKLSAVIFTKGCNMRCFYCHNKNLSFCEFLDNLTDINEIEILNYLSRRRNFLDAVVITGGEATMQTDIIVFLRKIKEIGYPIKIDTNGTNPYVLKKILEERLVDFVAMDIKTTLEYEEYLKISKDFSMKLFENIKTSVHILRKSKIEYLFRTTIVESIHTEDIITNLQKKFPKITFQKCRIQQQI